MPTPPASALPPDESSRLLSDLSLLEEVVKSNPYGLGGTHRIRAFSQLEKIAQALSRHRTLGDLRLELSIAIRAIPPSSSMDGQDGTEIERRAVEFWWSQALEVIERLRGSLPPPGSTALAG